MCASPQMKASYETLYSSLIPACAACRTAPEGSSSRAEKAIAIHPYMLSRSRMLRYIPFGDVLRERLLELARSFWELDLECATLADVSDVTQDGSVKEVFRCVPSHADCLSDEYEGGVASVVHRDANGASRICPGSIVGVRSDKKQRCGHCGLSTESIIQDPADGTYVPFHEKFQDDDLGDKLMWYCPVVPTHPLERYRQLKAEKTRRKRERQERKNAWKREQYRRQQRVRLAERKARIEG
ncbi:hypothetical protein FOL47_008106 [Perkinsus chesapeaki]|uniref:Uncharacterized protein n=1 Tax=Perkinsus chesapeaki TaxID=330153 RepID=A0A7J6LG53_PERCH|nr:hypothetical protein FOL47_008106 [Perkinsus chesapeaki]